MTTTANDVATFDTAERRAGRVARKPAFVVLVPGARVPAELDAEDARHAGRLAAAWTRPDGMSYPDAIICFVEPDGALTELGVVSAPQA
jgi:hypothetical protein